MTLTEFLLARIAEDEEAAHGAAAAMQSNYGTGSWDVRPDGRLGLGGGLSLGVGPVAPHVARHDPARVLAECEAKRRIVEEVLPIHPDYDPLYVQRLLALPYADHPDYQEAWRP